MAKVTAKAITRLQKFLAAIAGDATAPSPVTNNEKLLYNIAEAMNAAASAASTSELPEAKAADNGKVLGIVNGKWAVMELPTNDAATPTVEDGGLA